eukprot:UN32060
MQVEYVEWRQKKLQTYLQELILIPELVRTRQVCEFLIVPEEVRAMLQRRYNTENGDTQSHRGDTENNYSRQKGLRPEEQQIMDLLKNLSLEQHKVRALAKFERFFDKKPRYSSEYIKLLFIGDEAHQGLIQACGTFAHSKVARCAALNLVAKLLDIERNKEAPAFLDKFIKLDFRVFKELNLHRHILDAQTQLGGFQLSRILFEKLPDRTISEYIPEKWAEQEFVRWLNLQTNSVGKTVFDRPENVIDNGLEMQEGFNHNEGLLSHFGEIEKEFNKPSEDWRWLEKENERDDLKILYKKDANKDIWKLKCIFSVRCSTDDLYRYLCHKGISFLQPKVDRCEEIAQLDSVTKYIGQYSKFQLSV